MAALTGTACREVEPFGEADGGSVDPFVDYLGDPATACYASSGGWVDLTGMVFPQQAYAPTVTVEGYDSSAYPGDGATVQVERTSSPNNGVSDVGTDIDGTTGDWDVNPAVGTLDDCRYDSDPEACSGDYTATVESIDTGAIGLCSDLDPMRMDVDWEYTAKSDTSAESDCVAGSGTFALIPLVSVDRDLDGLRTLSAAPVMESGTGTMTARSWVTSINLAQSSSRTTRALKAGQGYRIGSNDVLVDPSNKAVTLTTSAQSLSNGTLRGYGAFVMEEVDFSSDSTPEIEMTWNCSAGANNVTRHPGYQLDLDDLDCGVDQKLTMRPVFDSGPRRLEFERYGAPATIVAVPTQVTSEGDAFAYSRALFHIDGVVTSVTSNGATVRIDHLTWDGTGICSTGTVTLAPE